MSNYEFKNNKIQKDFISYYTLRNTQIAEFKKQGLSWKQISELMGLSPEYIKILGHKQGVSGQQRNFKVPDRKCPMCGQTIISKTVGKARGVDHLNGSIPR